MTRDLHLHFTPLYIYIYIYRERERERERVNVAAHVNVAYVRHIESMSQHINSLCKTETLGRIGHI